MPNPYDPWSAKPDPRKSTVSCHVQLDVSQNLWLLARPLGLMAKADQGERLFPAGFTFYEYGTVYQSNLVVIGQPLYQLTVPCNLAKQCLLLKWHLIPYDIVGCPGQLVTYRLGCHALVLAAFL